MNNRIHEISLSFLPYNLTEPQKANRVKISKQILKLLNYSGHRILSKIISGDEAFFMFQLINEVKYKSLKINSTPE